MRNGRRAAASEDRQVRLHNPRPTFPRVVQAGLVGGDGDAGAVAELAVVEAEGPVVPGADGAAVLDEPAGQVAAGVGAVVVDDVDLLALAEDGELKAPHLGVFADALLELRLVTQRSPGHDASRYACGAPGTSGTPGGGASAGGLGGASGGGAWGGGASAGGGASPGGESGGIASEGPVVGAVVGRVVGPVSSGGGGRLGPPGPRVASDSDI